MLAHLVKEKGKQLKSTIDHHRTTGYQELFILTTMQKIMQRVPVDSRIVFTLDHENFVITARLHVSHKDFYFKDECEASNIQDVLKVLWKELTGNQSTRQPRVEETK